MNYIFTKNGERKVENFIQSCIEKRKKIINEGIDTGDLVDNAGKLSINDVLLSINYFHTSNLRNVRNSQLSMTRSIKNILQKISLMFLKIF